MATQVCHRPVAVARPLNAARWSPGGALWWLHAEQGRGVPGEQAEVTGKVRQMDLAEIADYCGLDLEDELCEDYAGDLVLVADDVAPADAATRE